MATITSKSYTAAAVVVIVAFSCFFTPATAFGRKVGGRTAVKAVEKNHEVQQLGRFAVKEYNRIHPTTNGQVVVFSHVVAAETRVVAGIKYYMKIEAAEHGETKVFESVVVVQPWMKSKKLIAFNRSPISSLF